MSADARTLLEQARKVSPRCDGRVVAYADGRTGQCRFTAGHEGKCE